MISSFGEFTWILTIWRIDAMRPGSGNNMSFNKLLILVATKGFVIIIDYPYNNTVFLAKRVSLILSRL